MTIDEKLIQSVCSTVTRGNRINRILPLGGKVVIDQLLPFICVYRYRVRPDPNFTHLLKTQASYLIVEESLSASHLLECIAHMATERFHSFLIMEFWPDKDPQSRQLQIYAPETRAPATVKALQKGFSEIGSIYPSLKVRVHNSLQRHPDHLSPLLSIDQSKEKGSLMIGIQIPPVYQDVDTQRAFTFFFREFRSGFSKTVKKAAFEFSRVQTTTEFTHYLTLGKTQLDNLVRYADKQLAEVSERMNFLMRVTPVNQAQEWENFKKNHFEKKPSFNYRLIPLDPELEKRKLYKIRIRNIEDPTLAFIFRDKRSELEKQLTMLEERETANFRYIGLSLYGEISDKELETADRLLNLTGGNHEEESLDCHQFAELARRELETYQAKFRGLDLQVQVRKDVSGIMVSKSHLFISTDFTVNAKRVEALLQHEVGTHILTYCNGHRQPLHQMYAGFAGYEQLQEGLAVMAEYLVGGLTLERLRLLAGRVRAVHCMVNGADFIETFRKLKDDFHFEPKTAYNLTMRVFRGGGFAKDAVYLIGVIKLLEYLKYDGNIEILYSGKFHLNHVNVIEELTHRKILNPPFLAPYLQSEKAQKRLRKLKTINNLDELLINQNHDYSIHH